MTEYDLFYRGSVESHQGDRVLDYWKTQNRHRVTGEEMITAVLRHGDREELILCRISSLRAERVEEG